MRIIPVIDLMGGSVVRGIAGRRSEYRPLVGGVANSCEPFAVAEAFRDRFGFAELYIADLDAIGGAAPDRRLFIELVARGFQLMVDAGVGDAPGAVALAECGATVIAGLETVGDRSTLSAIVRAAGGLIFGLDLRAGRPMRTWEGVAPDPESIVAAALDAGVDRVLVLDVARVGLGGGTGTEDLCRRLKRDGRVRELIVGGGISDASDLRRLSDCGADAVLVASALHDGRLSPDDCRPFAE